MWWMEISDAISFAIDASLEKGNLESFNVAASIVTTRAECTAAAISAIINCMA